MISLKEKISKIIQILDTIYPNGAIYDLAISSETQLAEIEKLKQTVKYEQCFFVVNLPERKLEHVHGISEWLGYANAAFSFMDYIKIIHPDHLPSLNTLASSAFEVANSGDFEVLFMNHRVVIQLPLLHSDNGYVLFKRSLYPFQFDRSTGKVLSYLNHFVLIRKYTSQDALDMRVAQYQRIVSPLEEAKVREVLSEHVGREIELPFNATELKILTLIAQDPDLPQREIAETLEIPLTSIRKTHNTRISKNFKVFFPEKELKSTKEIALFLKREGLI